MEMFLVSHPYFVVFWKEYIGQTLLLTMKPPDTCGCSGESNVYIGTFVDFNLPLKYVTMDNVILRENDRHTKVRSRSVSVALDSVGTIEVAARASDMPESSRGSKSTSVVERQKPHVQAPPSPIITPKLKIMSDSDLNKSEIRTLRLENFQLTANERKVKDQLAVLEPKLKVADELVKTLQGKISELEEKNRALMEEKKTLLENLEKKRLAEETTYKYIQVKEVATNLLIMDNIALRSREVIVNEVIGSQARQLNILDRFCAFEKLRADRYCELLNNFATQSLANSANSLQHEEPVAKKKKS